jgi:hypothetical protein
MSTKSTKENLGASITRPSPIKLSLSPEANNSRHHRHHQVRIRMNRCLYISSDILNYKYRLKSHNPGQL